MNFVASAALVLSALSFIPTTSATAAPQPVSAAVVVPDSVAVPMAVDVCAVDANDWKLKVVATSLYRARIYYRLSSSSKAQACVSVRAFKRPVGFRATVTITMPTKKVTSTKTSFYVGATTERCGRVAIAMSYTNPASPTGTKTVKSSTLYCASNGDGMAI